jgi:hypothetical protein
MVERRRRGTDTHDWHHLPCIQLLHPLHFVCSSPNASYSSSAAARWRRATAAASFHQERMACVTHRYFNPPQQADRPRGKQPVIRSSDTATILSTRSRQSLPRSEGPRDSTYNQMRNNMAIYERYCATPRRTRAFTLNTRDVHHRLVSKSTARMNSRGCRSLLFLRRLRFLHWCQLLLRKPAM